MNTTFTENERHDLGGLLELIGSYDGSEEEAFLLLGQVYKNAKRAGYRAGYRDAQAEQNRPGA